MAGDAFFREPADVGCRYAARVRQERGQGRWFGIKDVHGIGCDTLGLKGVKHRVLIDKGPPARC